MAAPFSVTSVSNYNVNPPTDDGATTSANQVKWSSTKTKIGDPIKTAFDTSESNTLAAFAKVLGGGAVLSTSVNYAVLAADQAKLVKVTASATTITTPDATAVASPFIFGVLNNSSGDITLAGANPGVQQTVDGSNSITISAGAGLLVCTDGTNWFTFGQNFARTQVVPQGRLTLTSGVPIIAGDVVSATAVYYTPYVGNLIPVSDGTKFNVEQFSELTLTLNANHTAANIYDIFHFNDSGTRRIGTGPAWNVATAGSCARGTGAGTTDLARFNGLLTNANSMTARNGASTYTVAANRGLYLGSIYIDGTNGQASCYRAAGQSRKWAPWNMFNRSPVSLQLQDPTASWVYTTAAWRQSNGAASNFATSFIGLAEEQLIIAFDQRVGNANNGISQQIAIGINSTSGPSGGVASVSGPGLGVNFLTVASSELISPPLLGINNVYPVELGSGGGGSTFYGGAANMILTVSYMA